MDTTYHHELSIDGYEVGVLTYPLGAQSVCISDALVQQFRIMLAPTETGAVSVGVDIEIFDDRPGELANYTHDHRIECAVSDVLEISEEGVFTAMARARTASKWHLCMGLTLQLPASAVPVVRRGIEIARALAAKTSAEQT